MNKYGDVNIRFEVVLMGSDEYVKYVKLRGFLYSPRIIRQQIPPPHGIMFQTLNLDTSSSYFSFVYGTVKR